MNLVKWLTSLRLKPFECSHVELFFIRAIVAWMVWDIYQDAGDWSGQAEPVGLARFVDLTFFSSGSFHNATAPILLFACAAYVFGIGFPVVLPVMTLLVIGTETLENSQGSTNHNTQILALCLVVQTIWHFVSMGLRGWSWGVFGDDGKRREEMSVWFSMQVIAACYVVSGISKLLGKGNWVLDSVNYPLQLIKTERMGYYNELQSHVVENPGWIQGMGLWMRELLIANPWINPFVLSIGLLLELFAFLAFFGRLPALVLGVLLIAFHFTVHLIMNLTFQYNILLLTAFFVFPVYWIERRLAAK